MLCDQAGTCRSLEGCRAVGVGGSTQGYSLGMELWRGWAEVLLAAGVTHTLQSINLQQLPPRSLLSAGFSLRAWGCPWLLQSAFWS